MWSMVSCFISSLPHADYLISSNTVWAHTGTICTLGALIRLSLLSPLPVFQQHLDTKYLWGSICHISLIFLRKHEVLSQGGLQEKKCLMLDQQKNNCSLSGFISPCTFLVPQGWQLLNHPKPMQSHVKTIKALNKDPKRRSNQYGISLLPDRWLRWFFVNKRSFSIYYFLLKACFPMCRGSADQTAPLIDEPWRHLQLNLA